MAQKISGLGDPLKRNRLLVPQVKKPEQLQLWYPWLGSSVETADWQDSMNGDLQYLGRRNICSGFSHL